MVAFLLSLQEIEYVVCLCFVACRLLQQIEDCLAEFVVVVFLHKTQNLMASFTNSFALSHTERNHTFYECVCNLQVYASFQYLEYLFQVDLRLLQAGGKYKVNERCHVVRD